MAEDRNVRMRVTLPDGRRMRLSGPSREAVLSKARELGQQAAPQQPQQPRQSQQAEQAQQGLLGRVLGPFRAFNELATAPTRAATEAVTGTPVEEFSETALAPDNLPTTLATAGSLLVPPLQAGAAAARVAPLLGRLGLGTGGLLGLGARGAARFGPSIGAAGAGGAIGGGTAEAVRGGGLLDIAAEAGRSGAEQAGAEAAGAGIGAVAARTAAPALGLLTDQSRRALRFARGNTLPESRGILFGRERALPVSPADVAPGRLQTAVQAVADTLIPSRAATQSVRRAVTARALETPPDQANQVIRRLIQLDTSDAALPSSTKAAERVARALGQRQARRLGFESDGPRRFIRRALERDAGAFSRLGQKAREDALNVGLAGLIETATDRVDGRRVINGQRLLQLWRNLPEATRALYPAATRDAVEGFGAFAAVSSEVPRLAREPVIQFGPGVVSSSVGAAPFLAAGLGVDPLTAGSAGVIGAGVPFLTAKALMNPRSLLNRWLTSETLPPDLVQAIGGQATRAPLRERASGLLNDETEE